MSDNNKNKDYNLEERTAKFGENIRKFAIQLMVKINSLKIGY